MKQLITEFFKGKAKILCVSPLRLDVIPDDTQEQDTILTNSFSNTTLLQLTQLCAKNGAIFEIDAIREKFDNFGTSCGGVFGRVPKSRLVPRLVIWYKDETDNAT